jgi:hypothetical protein
MSWVDRGILRSLASNRDNHFPGQEASPGLSKLELAGVLAQFIGIHFTR